MAVSCRKGAVPEMSRAHEIWQLIAVGGSRGGFCMCLGGQSGQWAIACLLSSLSFMALLWLKTQMKIGLKECKPELQVWGSQVYSSWASISSSEPALLDLAAGLAYCCLVRPSHWGCSPMSPVLTRVESLGRLVRWPCCWPPGTACSSPQAQGSILASLKAFWAQIPKGAHTPESTANQQAKMP